MKVTYTYIPSCIQTSLRMHDVNVTNALLQTGRGCQVMHRREALLQWLNTLIYVAILQKEGAI